tara:strand:+ start:938 stop:1516 length:579 start_codon:yes stop_codon:yes gene_type:complete
MLENQIKITGLKILDESILIVFALITICILGPIKLELSTSLPITSQSLLVVWFALAFGLRIGLTAVLLYLIAGGMGFGVYAGGASGWNQFIGSNGGFLLAFPIGAFLSGSLAKWALTKSIFSKAKFITSALILIISQFVVLGLGIFWQSSMSPKSISIVEVIKTFMPELFILTAIGTIVLVLVSRALSRIKS